MKKFIKAKQILVFLCICYCNLSLSQTQDQKKDSTKSTLQNLDDFSQKSKFGKLVHRLLVKPKKQPKTNSNLTQRQNLAAFEGKIIRNIVIQSHDPFGFSFTDPTKVPNTWIEKTGNALHTKSKQFAIRNFLIIKKNKPLDSLKLIESERLIRGEKFIRSVEITVKSIAATTDSVDVYVTALDSWSLIPGGGISNSEIKLQLAEQNFLGFGHELKIAEKQRFEDDKVATNLYYSIPNIKNTYIRSELIYNTDYDKTYSKIFSVGRTFFSPFTKWAANIYVDEQFNREVLPDVNLILETQNFKYRSNDIWGGYSFRLFRGNTERKRTANIVAAARRLDLKYAEKPTVDYDIIDFFSSENFYLGSVGFTSRQFVKDTHIFRDGIVENVPTGDVLAFTAGNQYKNGKNRPYFGAKIAHGSYYKWGYLSASFEYGTFYSHSRKEQITYSFTANYFSNLVALGSKWKMRQFITTQVVIGENRLNTIGDRLTIDDANYYERFDVSEEQRRSKVQIPGFKGGLLGTSKFLLAYQSQFYTDWEFIGFRVNPYLNVIGGMIGNEERRFITNKLYSSFSIGIILRNDYLVFNAVKLSLSYYPTIPLDGNNIFKTNAINTEDFGLQGFEIQKPAPVYYN